MPSGYITCPICNGAGTITEDTLEYEFVTRDPKTDTCLICAGKGLLPVSAKLPDGTPARALTKPRAKLASVTDKRLRAPSEPHPIREYLTPAYHPRADRPLTAALDQRGITTSPRHHDTTPEPQAPAPCALTIEPQHPAYPHIYALLRILERARGTWTAQDEEAYITGLNTHIHLKETNNG